MAFFDVVTGDIGLKEQENQHQVFVVEPESEECVLAEPAEPAEPAPPLLAPKEEAAVLPLPFCFVPPPPLPDLPDLTSTACFVQHQTSSYSPEQFFIGSSVAFTVGMGLGLLFAKILIGSQQQSCPWNCEE